MSYVGRNLSINRGMRPTGSFPKSLAGVTIRSVMNGHHASEIAVEAPPHRPVWRASPMMTIALPPWWLPLAPGSSDHVFASSLPCAGYLVTAQAGLPAGVTGVARLCQNIPSPP